LYEQPFLRLKRFFAVGSGAGTSARATLSSSALPLERV
jgi:hypothetical protein